MDSPAADAPELDLSSSSFCRFVSACLSDHVNLVPLGVGAVALDAAAPPEKAAIRSLMLPPVDGASGELSCAPPGFHRLANFPGVASLTGSYAVPTGAMRSSDAGLEASAGAGVDAEAIRSGAEGRDAAGIAGGAAGAGGGDGVGSGEGCRGAVGGTCAAEATGVGRPKMEAGVETVAGCP